MFSRVFALAVFLLAVPLSAGAQDFRASEPSENPTEATGAVTFEFYAQTSVGRVESGQTFTLEISAIQKWGEAPEPLELEVPGLEKFQVVSEKESTRSFNDFRGDPTYDTTYLLELAATATGNYTLGPVTARDATGRAMTSDPMRVEVIPAASAPATGSAARPIARTQTPAAADRLHSLLMVLGTLAAIFIALYVVLAIFARVRPASALAIETLAPTTDLPAGLLGESELFALLSARYGRDVRPLTTREIAELESDPDDRVHVTALLDHVRASRYADRHS